MSHYWLYLRMVRYRERQLRLNQSEEERSMRFEMRSNQTYFQHRQRTNTQSRTPESATALTEGETDSVQRRQKAENSPVVLRGINPDSDDPSTHHQTEPFREAGTTRAGLLDLPAEILDRIFLCSGNLELAYVCRRMWFSVSYSQLSRDLSMVAFFSSSLLDGHPFATRDEDHNLLRQGTTAILEQLRTLTWLGIATHDVRVQLQDELYRCLWFTERHLQYLRHTLLRNSIASICKRHELFVSVEQWSQIEVFLDKHRSSWALPSDAGSPERDDLLSFHPCDKNGIVFQGVLHPNFTLIWSCNADGGPCQDTRTCSHDSKDVNGMTPEFAAPFRPVNPECLVHDVGRCDQRAYDLVLAIFQLEVFGAWANRIFWYFSASRRNVVISHRFFTSYPIHLHLICWMPSEVMQAVVCQIGEKFTDKTGESSHPDGDKCLDLLLCLGRHHEMDFCRTEATRPIIMRKFDRFWKACYADALQSGNIAGVRRLLQFEATNTITDSSR